MNVSKFLLNVLVCIVIIGCGTDSGNPSDPWNEQGLQNSEIETLELAEDQIFTGTNGSIYKGKWATENIQWEILDFQFNTDTSYISDLVYTHDKLYALLRSKMSYFDLHEEYRVLYKTENLGETWNPVTITLEGQEKPYVFNNITGLKDDPTLYGEAGYVFKSTDNGKYWVNTTKDEITGSPRFLFQSKGHPHQIWTGGSMDIPIPYLSKSTDGGETWINLNQNFGNGSATVYSVIIAPEDEQTVLAGLGSSIQKSTDGGETWEMVLAGKSINSFQNSITNPGRVYAAGYSSSVLFVAVSNDYGDTWDVIEYDNSPAGIETNELEIAEVNGKETLFFATTNGVYSYTIEP